MLNLLLKLLAYWSAAEHTAVKFSLRSTVSFASGSFEHQIEKILKCIKFNAKIALFGSLKFNIKLGIVHKEH
jgi:hypothetical protein